MIPELLDKITPTLIGGLLALGGVLLNSILNRRARGDAFSLKILEDRLKAFPQVQEQLSRAHWAASTYLFKLDTDSGELGMAVDALHEQIPLRDTTARYAHLFSPETAEALASFSTRAFQVVTADGRREHRKQWEEELRVLVVAARAHLRRDCGGDRATKQLRSVIAPEPLIVPARWAKAIAADPELSQKVLAAKPAALPSGDGSAS
jgi:hypothetical protein